jgi:hypothetical protein
MDEPFVANSVTALASHSTDVSEERSDWGRLFLNSLARLVVSDRCMGRKARQRFYVRTRATDAKAPDARPFSRIDISKVRELGCLRFIAYWRSKSEGDEIPLRIAFDPLIEEPTLAPGFCIYDVAPENDFYVRLIGTEAARLLGKNITGQRVSQFWPTEDAGAVLEMLRSCLENATPTAGQGSSIITRQGGEFIEWQTVAVPVRRTRAPYFQVFGFIGALDDSSKLKTYSANKSEGTSNVNPTASDAGAHVPSEPIERRDSPRGGLTATGAMMSANSMAPERVAAILREIVPDEKIVAAVLDAIARKTNSGSVIAHLCEISAEIEAEFDRVGTAGLNPPSGASREQTVAARERFGSLALRLQAIGYAIQLFAAQCATANEEPGNSQPSADRR